MPPTSYDPHQRRKDFPALAQEVNGHPLVYLDNAATTQRPECVIDELSRFYREDNANVHRGIHELSRRATDAYESARKRAAEFFQAGSPRSVVFTRGTTEAINLVAYTWGQSHLQAGDRILLTEMEHHSNLVPWQMLAERSGAELDFVPIDQEGMLDMDALEQKCKPSVKLLAMTHVSNTLGTVNPVETICRHAREQGILTLIDGAQAAGHRPVSFEKIGCDFYCFSGHKMAGPLGIGGLIGRLPVLEELPPWQGGGEMISRVDWHQSRWNEVPHKFEAGTPHVAGALGLHRAMDYLDEVGRETICSHDAKLAAEAYRQLKDLEGVRVFGPDPEHGHEHAGAVSFVLDSVHAHDVVSLADGYGLAVRGGHHCNQPLMKKLGIPASVRASFYLYNEPGEIDRLIEGVKAIQAYFKR
jgi:cysteine desulfurase/selenocysteine lyase